MAIIAKYTTRSETKFNLALSVFIVYECFCFIMIFLAVMKLFKFDYGLEFRRKVFIKSINKIGEVKVEL